jgi:hypothetical protein
MRRRATNVFLFGAMVSFDGSDNVAIESLLLLSWRRPSQAVGIYDCPTRHSPTKLKSSRRLSTTSRVQNDVRLH